jgi:Tol biopolymer transport system component/DNA-binding winged helix-turn-helix (wHTH) protein
LFEREGELRKNGTRIRLQEQPFRVLVELAANAGKMVAREELQQKLWPADTFVDFDTGLNTAIRKLRQALNDNADEPRYIETLARRGYRFIAPVEVASPASQAPSAHSVETTQAETPISKPGIDHPLVADAKPLAEASAVAVAVGRPPEALSTATTRDKKWAWVALGAVAAVVLVALVFRWTQPAAPIIGAITQLTDDEEGKANVQTDGARIYFNEISQGSLNIAQVAVKGGPVATIPTSVVTPTVGGIAPDGSSLLVLSGSTPVPRPVWEIPLPVGEARRLGSLDAHEASVTPDGHILLSRIEDLWISARDGSNARKILSLSGAHFGDAAMSPDGRRIVFTRYGEQPELYLVNSDGSGLQLLAKNNEPGGFCCARWTADGQYIVFATRFPMTRQDLWYLRMKSGWLQGTDEPHRLTAGPLSYRNPVPSPDGKSIFAVGIKRRGELLRYDLTTRSLAPFSPGLTAASPSAGLSDLTFSSDGQWMAYVTYPDHILWRSRSDGSERQQLTFSPVQVQDPCISPDGKWVVYRESQGYGIYIIGRDGGAPRKVSDGWSPTWSPDGNFVVFSATTESWQTPEVKILDLQTGKVRLVPGGQMLPRWAAPGRIIAARRDLMALQIYDLATQQWSDLTNPNDGPITSWAHSPDFKYFYFTTNGREPRLVRVHMNGLTLEVVARLADLALPNRGEGATQISVAPDNSPLFTVEAGSQEIYALEVKWP